MAQSPADRAKMAVSQLMDKYETIDTLPDPNELFRDFLHVTTDVFGGHYLVSMEENYTVTSPEGSENYLLLVTWFRSETAPHAFAVAAFDEDSHGFSIASSTNHADWPKWLDPIIAKHTTAILISDSDQMDKLASIVPDTPQKPN